MWKPGDVSEEFGKMQKAMAILTAYCDNSPEFASHRVAAWQACRDDLDEVAVGRAMLGALLVNNLGHATSRTVDKTLSDLGATINRIAEGELPDNAPATED
ncbi:MAG: hypothetical protein M3256_22970 [Actinomycetota bacterium]|nr:hypothetical protein [Actinomycetota bacterium]